MTDTRPPMPPVVYAPTVEHADGSPRLAMHRTHDGRVALFVYSALDRLADFYDADSAWVLLSVADLQAAHDQAPYDLLYLDKRPSSAPVVAGAR
ncbi:hypothetical protein NOK12_13620 [Nocardioides sp. OK12]|uniref:SAV_915 family protein n=1 Tax=Nocardioides sp. OK12 TaxID=2758661 RepID=UPI0021C3967B|nr:SAV_915 family protein [Nocardioides sp. OK12]GHJ58844.1 hypothetical protein NOK12_13620 [Nocardioides sp. OK12]